VWCSMKRSGPYVKGSVEESSNHGVLGRPFEVM